LFLIVCEHFKSFVLIFFEETITVIKIPKIEMSYVFVILIKTISLKSAYNMSSKSLEAKKQDIIFQCHLNLIPMQYHDFYENLLMENSTF